MIKKATFSSGDSSVDPRSGVVILQSCLTSVLFALKCTEKVQNNWNSIHIINVSYSMLGEKMSIFIFFSNGGGYLK